MNIFRLNLINLTNIKLTHTENELTNVLSDKSKEHTNFQTAENIAMIYMTILGYLLMITTKFNKYWIFLNINPTANEYEIYGQIDIIPPPPKLAIK